MHLTGVDVSENNGNEHHGVPVDSVHGYVMHLVDADGIENKEMISTGTQETLWTTMIRTLLAPTAVGTRVMSTSGTQGS